MRMPFEGGFRISSPYGMRADPLTGEASWHGGLDLVGADGAVRCVVPGTVLQSRMVTDPANRTSEWGNYVSVYGEDGRTYYYCHLASRAVRQGDRAEAGEILGIQGMTGRATGVHLHFEVREGLAQLDPAALLGIPNEAGYVRSPAPARWYDEAMDWAAAEGILLGGGNGLAPEEPCTRAMAATMLYRMWKRLKAE